ncbi:G-patch domain and KOW motifs-containing protein-like [Andrena cerasifolii]|uniref:G-patch domain and KOW motifs-containing protein-like n=1 Tax=Andrena cerasifolii TaxID=2819439 RepID=UPI0040381E2B
MAEEGKKISFGFAKSIRKPVLKQTLPQEPKKVDYIECLDEKSIKVIGEEEKKDEPLVIPLLGSKTWHERIVNRIDADIFEPRTKESKENANVKQEEVDLTNGSTSPKIKLEPVEVEEIKVVTLEEQAAKEIIAELTSNEKQETESKTLTLPLVDDQSLRGKDQSTLEDYEKIPVDAFGVAMLRGMGWQPGKGIGKNEKLVSALTPELRPKGMGLGADKVTLQKQTTNSKKQEEELKIEKGTFVKIIAGKQSNAYGQIEGFDDDAGRLIIKLALGGNTISVNEFMVQPVTNSEYSKNAKVLNAKKYEEYKDKKSKESKETKHKIVKKRKSTPSECSEGSKDEERSNFDEEQKKGGKHDRNKSDRVDKKSKSRKRHSESDSDNDSEYGKRRKHGRSRSGSSESYKSKKSKKSKKHKKQDSSPERSSKKHKKKDKEREKTKDRTSRSHAEKRKHKKRGRSRSRSSSKR